MKQPKIKVNLEKVQIGPLEGKGVEQIKALIQKDIDAKSRNRSGGALRPES